MGAVGYSQSFLAARCRATMASEFGIVDERRQGPIAFEPFGLALPAAIDEPSKIFERALAFTGQSPDTSCLKPIPGDVLAHRSR